MSILCIVFYYEYQCQAFSGLIRRVFIIQSETVSYSEQFEVLLELYIDPGVSQVDPRTYLPGNISSSLWNKYIFIQKVSLYENHRYNVWVPLL